MTLRDTLETMPRAVSVRLDDDAIRALRIIEATGLSQSDAIRTAILGQAARLRQHSSLAAEVAALEANETDRQEVRAITEMMEDLREPW